MGMFDNLRKAFQEAVDNFKEEMSRDEVPEAVDRLLKGMYQEVTDAKAYLQKLQEQVALTSKQAERERAEAATCRRRQQMAEKIQDEDTARVAREFAEKHETTSRVLERKAVAIQEELDVRKAEVEDMMARIKEARKERDGLAAVAGRTSARESMGKTDDLFTELDRMAERILGEEGRARAAEVMSEEMGDAPLPPDEEPGHDVDARLAELKRRMGRDS